MFCLCNALKASLSQLARLGARNQDESAETSENNAQQETKTPGYAMSDGTVTDKQNLDLNERFR